MPETVLATGPDSATIDARPGLYPFEIRSADTDFADRLQVSTLFALMQESAYHHAEQLGIGTRLLDALDLTWMLSRISVRLDRLPHWGEQVWIRTWSRGARRLLFERDFEFISGSPDAPPFGRGTSEWLVVRRDNHRPQRPDQVFSNYNLNLTNEAPAVFDFQCPKIESIRGQSGPGQTGPGLNGKGQTGPGLPDRKPDLLKYADFSEIDRNRHVNNTRYIAWSMDAAYASLFGGLQELANPAARALDLRAMDINYLSEIRPGERVHLFVEQVIEEPVRTIVVEGIKSDQSTASFRARMQFA